MFLLFVAEFHWLCSLYQHGCGLVLEGVDGDFENGDFSSEHADDLAWFSLEDDERL